MLIRAIAPLVGLGDDLAIGRGPGKVTRALRLSRAQDRRDLSRGGLFVARVAGLRVPRGGIAVGPRIGVAYAGAWATRPLRFWWRGHASVSGRR